MSRSKNIQDLKEFAQIFANNARALQQTLEVFLYPERNKTLRDLYWSNALIGFLAVRDSLLANLVLGICRLAYGKCENPDLDYFRQALFRVDASKVREQLRERYSRDLPRSSPNLRAKSTEIGEVSLLEEEQGESLKGKIPFYEKLLRFEAICVWFEERQDNFNDLKDKMIAHLEVTRIEKIYRETPVEGTTLAELTEASNYLAEVGGILEKLVCGHDPSSEQFQKLAEADAKKFWEFVRPRQLSS